jgi:hypothetical protein
MGGGYANNMTVNLEEIQKGLRILVNPGRVVEHRILGETGKGVCSKMLTGCL